MKNKLKSFFNRLSHTLIPYIFFGAILGIITAFVIYGFVFLADKSIALSLKVYACVREKPVYLPLLILGVSALAIGSGFIIKLVPDVRGGGVPFVKGLARGKLTVKWFFTLPVMAVSTLINILIGLPLGNEGSSIYIGGNIGYGGSRLLNQREQSTRIMTTAGACSALAVVFNAPLMGIFFALEEGQKRLNAQVIVPTVTAVVAGMLTKTYVFGASEYFSGLTGSMDANISFPHVGSAFIIGILTALLACLYNLSNFLNIKPLKKIPVQLRVLFPALLAIPLTLISPFYAGSAKPVFAEVINATIMSVSLILIFRFLVLALTARSGASGGTFIQQMSIGACVGALVSAFFTFMGLENNITFLVFMGASAMISASLRAPFASIVLVFEMTALDFSGVLAVTVCVITAYTLAELLRAKPLYEGLLNKMLTNAHHHENENTNIELSAKGESI